MEGSYTIQIYVAGGRSSGVRIIERPGSWSGLIIHFPRNSVSGALSLDALSSGGIYILWAMVDDACQIYIGQGENVSARIAAHQRAKVFWTSAVALVAQAGTLNCAHARWLEHKLIYLYGGDPTYKVMNGMKPVEPKLSLADMSICQTYLQIFLETLPMVGLNLLLPDSNIQVSSEVNRLSRGGPIISDGHDAYVA